METVKKNDSILHVLKSSIDHIWTVKKSPTTCPKQLEIQMSASYILKDRSLDCSSALTVIPEVLEEHCSNEQPSNYSKFSTKIEFIKPKQRASEDSPSSVKSQSSDFQESPRKPILKDKFSFSKAVRAKEEIQSLRKNKEKLQQKIATLSQSLDKLQEFRQEDSTRRSLELKLQKLEGQQISPEKDSRFPEAALKLQNLEKEIKGLKQLKDSSVFQYEKELSTINHKLKDLQECNAILTEILACFKKDPILLSPLSEDTFSPEKNVLNTVKLEGLADQTRVLEEAYARKEQLIKTKERLEAELREIPDNSRSLSSKRQKLSLEYELSVNSSQLASINEKIKRNSCL